MSFNFAAVVGNEVMFFQDLIKPNGLIAKVPVSYYYSDWGFIIPMEFNGLNVLAYLNGDRDLEVMTEGTIKAYLITHEGELEEWSSRPTGPVGMMRRILPWGPEVAHCRSNTMDLEEIWTAALDATDDNLDAALAIVQQTTRSSSARIVKLQIPDIIKELNERFPRKGKRRALRGTQRES
ncbi:hypothetical protein D3C85_1061990 [compost metagenome]